MFTKTARFLLLMSVVSQDITRDRFRFVPHLGVYDRPYSDEYLCNIWGISSTEFEYIKARVGEAGGDE